MDERIIGKIRKCMALSLNNTNIEEATSATLMAQKLMAKHGISAVDLENEGLEEKETIDHSMVEVGAGKSWKYQLAHIVADNFRCKTFCYGNKSIAFYGYETDAETAKEVFSFLFKLGDRMAERVTHKRWEETGNRKGVYNSWVLGYIHGIKLKLDEQCKALMIIISPEVTTQYSEFMQGAKSIKDHFRINNGLDNSVYSDGVSAGKSAISSKELEAK